MSDVETFLPHGANSVMATRIEARDSLDDFPTPPWATRALCELLGDGIATQIVWEPACNRGHMALPLAEYFFKTYASDIHHYGWEGQVDTDDFLSTEICSGVDWVITNPPFRLAQQFIEKGLRVANNGVAVIVRTAFLESVGRYNSLFKDNPPTIVAQFTERVPMVKGRLTATGSTATAYCWLIWDKTGPKGTAPRFVWIPPCRKRLERAGDYPAE